MDRSNPFFSIRRSPMEEALSSTVTADVRPGRMGAAAAQDGFGKNSMALPCSIQLQKSSRLIREFNNFKRSAAPSRFLFVQDGSWTEFPPIVFDALRNQFVAGNTAFEFSIAGKSYFFDFLRMCQVNTETGASNSIGWIDVHGRCFFPIVPPLAIDEEGNSRRPGHERDARSDQVASPAVVSVEYNPAGLRQERSCDSHESSSIDGTDQPRWPRVEALGDGDKYFKVVAKLFLSGFRRFAPNTVVTSIHKCSHSGPLGAARLRAFQIQVQMTKAARGDANVKFGWYGASATEVAAIVAHGFEQLRRPGSDACGVVGVHFSAPHSPYSSSLSLEVDDAGERHMVLCRVIMGRPEKVDTGSTQHHPSSEEFDSGVDDHANPMWYVVWSTRMNTHVLPEFVVSYKSSKQAQGAPKSVNSGRTSALNLQFPELLAEMGRCLPSSMARSLQIVYKQYKRRTITKETFIRYVRSIVGDKVLISAIKRIRGD